jgi:hypothetical protein
MIDATRAHFEQQLNPGSGGNQAARVSQQRNAGVIFVRNDSGADRDRFDVLGIDAPIVLPGDNLDEFKRQVTFTGVTPAEDDHAQKFVVLQEPVAAGQLGRAVIHGVTVARVSVETGDETAAGITDNDPSSLSASDTGAAQILWLEGVSGTPGIVWAIVRLGGGGSANVPRFRARLTGSSSIGANRWSYSFVEVEPDLTGTFKDLAGGRTGTAYNTMEANNAASGTLGSGDDPANFPSGVELQPIGPAVVWIDEDLDCNDEPIFLFQASNNPGGACA